MASKNVAISHKADAAKVLHHEDVSEAELVARAQRDPAEFAALYRRYLAPVYYYLLSRVGSRSEAEDLAAQVFLEALEGLPGYRHQGHFAAWLFTIARRRAADHYRRKHPELPLEQAPELHGPGQDPLLQLIHAEEMSRLAKLLIRLEETERELLRLRFAAGLTFTEMAALLKRKESSVKMSFYRLLARLESQLEADHD